MASSPQASPSLTGSVRRVTWGPISDGGVLPRRYSRAAFGIFASQFSETEATAFLHRGRCRRVRRDTKHGTNQAPARRPEQWRPERMDLAKRGEFAADLGNVERVEVLPFHQMGRYKWERLGLDYTLRDVEPTTTEAAELASEMFRKAGLRAS